MNRLVLSGVALALMAGQAMAADMRVKAPAMPPPMPTFSWSGCYLDAGAGYGLWTQDHNMTFSPANGGGTIIDSTGGGRGWLGRFGGGCDIQLSGTYFSNFLIGFFGDYDAADLTGSLSPLSVLGGFPLVADEKESSAWAVGGRIGYAIGPQILTYVDGGWTEARFDQLNETTNFGVPTVFGFPSHTYNGWFLGSGFEYNFNWLPIQGLFLRTEYRYASYQRDDLAEFNVVNGLNDGNVLHAKKVIQTVTTSLVWRFNFFH